MSYYSLYRWEYSRPPRRWIGVWDSTRVRPMCLQPACGVDAQPGLCLPMVYIIFFGNYYA